MKVVAEFARLTGLDPTSKTDGDSGKFRSMADFIFEEEPEMIHFVAEITGGEEAIVRARKDENMNWVEGWTNKDVAETDDEFALRILQAILTVVRQAHEK